MSARIKPKERALRLLRDEYPRALLPREVAKGIGSGVKRTTATLGELVDEGTVRRLTTGRYRAEPPPLPQGP